MPRLIPFKPKTIKQPWGLEELVARVPGIATAKLLRRYASGQRAGLQYHEMKHECFYLLEGQCFVYWDPGDGQLRKHKMRPGESFIVPPGTPHSVETIGDSIMVEASNDVQDDRVRVEDNYNIEDAIDA